MRNTNKLEQCFEALEEYFEKFPEEDKAGVVCDEKFVLLDSFYARELNRLMKDTNYGGVDLPDYVKEVQGGYEDLVDKIDGLRKEIVNEEIRKQCEKTRTAGFRPSIEERDRCVRLLEGLERNSFDAQIYGDFVSGDY